MEANAGSPLSPGQVAGGGSESGNSLLRTRCPSPRARPALRRTYAKTNGATTTTRGWQRTTAHLPPEGLASRTTTDTGAPLGRQPAVSPRVTRRASRTWRAGPTARRRGRGGRGARAPPEGDPLRRGVVQSPSVCPFPRRPTMVSCYATHQRPRKASVGRGTRDISVELRGVAIRCAAIRGAAIRGASPCGAAGRIYGLGGTPGADLRFGWHPGSRTPGARWHPGSPERPLQRKGRG